MSVKMEKMDDNRVQLTIEVEPDAFAAATQAAYRRMVGSIAIPGFRKGKAPRKVIENHYGDTVFFEDAVNKLIPETYQKALEENDIFAVSQPEIDVVRMGKDEPFVYTAVLYVKPEFELKAYKGVPAKRFAASVSDADVDAFIQQERERAARWVDVDRPVQDGDQVMLDFTGRVDGVAFEGGAATNHTLEIGSGSFIPGFEEQLVGVQKGEEKVVTVTFPETYHVDDLAGKEAEFTVFVHEIKEKELPEVDDEFVKDISEYDNLLEYRQNVRNQLLNRAKQQAQAREEESLVASIVDAYDFPIPEAMIENRVDIMVRDTDMRLQMQGLNLSQYLSVTGGNEADFRAGYRENAEKAVRTDLILEAIGRAEGIEFDPDAVEQEIKERAERNGITPQEYKERYASTVEVLQDRNQIERILQFLKDSAKWETEA